MTSETRRVQHRRPAPEVELPAGLLEAVRVAILGVSMQSSLSSLVFLLAEAEVVKRRCVRPAQIQEAVMRLAEGQVINIWNYLPQPTPNGIHRRDAHSALTPVGV